MSIYRYITESFVELSPMLSLYSSLYVHLRLIPVIEKRLWTEAVTVDGCSWLGSWCPVSGVLTLLLTTLTGIASN